MTNTTPKKTRKTDSENTQKYKAKRQTHRVELNFYADDDIERELIEKIKQLKAEKNLKYVFIQALTEFFEKNQK